VQDESGFVELPPNLRPARWTASFISVNAPNVILEALKPSADGDPDDFLLRLQEIAGKPTELSLKLPLPVRSIAETTLTEDRVLRPGIAANAVHVSPYQTLTLRISVVHQSGVALGENN
jgi:alpha-mannosidase